MAVFRSYAAHVKDNDVTVYTVPSGKTAIVIGSQAANAHEELLDLSVWWTDADDNDEPYSLLNKVVIPESASLVPIGGKLILAEGDQIKAVSEGAEDEDNGIDITLSVLEMDA